VVAETAPEELPLLDALSRYDDDKALRLMTRRVRRRDPLGFGLDEVVVLTSPVVWVVVSEAAKRTANSAIDGASTVTRFGLRKMFGRKWSASTVPALTREQIAEVRQRVFEEAVHNGLDRQRAEAVADAVVRRLLLDKRPDQQ
jgi:hypothetical protein